MRLSFSCADFAYCDYLRQTDPCVPYTMDKKETRPFIGVVFEINGINYYAPLSSPKPKHLKMKNQMDFLKIEEGKWGAINFNNMIPIHQNSLSRVEMKVLPTDTKEDKMYKDLLNNQLDWCNANQGAIVSRAARLYNIIVQGRGNLSLVARCCRFRENESQYIKFCQENNFTLPAQNAGKSSEESTE
ncbi:MAG: type III toxin-antitoxin system ToxN/AbiQ family toxin [Clostridiales bacterium]|jgi:protein AbiQ|nr:type III toxin-antitoxin system ToxN/AbiQ family toxin [Clostridiales bacterium]